MEKIDELHNILHDFVKNMRSKMEKKLSNFGFGHTEMRLLMMLYQRGSSNQDELSSRLDVDKSNAGRALKKLEQLGYVKRVKDTRDKRANTVFLTKEGEGLKENVLKIKSDLREGVWDGVSQNKINMLIQVFKKAISNLAD